MRIENARAGLMLNHVIISELKITNKLATFTDFDENSEILDMDYEIFNEKYEEDVYSAELRLITKVVIKENTKKLFEFKIIHLGFLSAPISAFKTLEDFVKAVELNGLASLISFARANIASITSIVLCQGSVILPMINVFKLNALKREEEE